MQYGNVKRNSLLFAPNHLREPEERPVCRRSERCRGCPHAHHGFICWGADETCLRSRMDKINKKENSNHDNKRNS